MTTTTERIIHSGTTDVGMRFCQFWGDTKVAGMTVEACFAYMADRDGAVDFHVRPYCPRELIPEILDAYRLFLEGGNLDRTHDCSWGSGKPFFTPTQEGTK